MAADADDASPQNENLYDDLLNQIQDGATEISFKSLMMGVSNYQLKEFEALPATVNDIEVMRELFQDSPFEDCGEMEVAFPRHNNTKSERHLIRNAIKVLKAKVKRDFEQLIP